MALVNIEFKTLRASQAHKEAQQIAAAIREIESAQKQVAAQSNKTAAEIRRAFQQSFTRNMETQFRRVKQSAQELGVSTSTLSRDFGLMKAQAIQGRVSMEQFQRSASRFNSELLRVQSRTNVASAALDKFTSSVRRTAAANDQAATGSGRFTGQVSRLAQQIRLVEGPLGGTAARVSTFAAILRSANGPLAALTITLSLLSAGLGVAAVQLFKFQLSLDPITMKLAATIGGVKAAREQMDFLMATSLNLGVNFQVAADNFATLQAAAVNTSLTLGEVKQLFIGVTTAASALALPSHQVGLIFKTFIDMISKGRVSMEELRRQLGNSLPGALQIAAAAMGTTTDALIKMVENGELASDVLVRKLGPELERRFAKGAGISTLNKELNRMKTELQGIARIFLEDLGGGELFDTLAEKMRNWITTVRVALKLFAEQMNEQSEKAAQGPQNSGKAWSAPLDWSGSGKNPYLNTVLPTEDLSLMVNSALDQIKMKSAVAEGESANFFDAMREGIQDAREKLNKEYEKLLNDRQKMFERVYSSGPHPSEMLNRKYPAIEREIEIRTKARAAATEHMNDIMEEGRRITLEMLTPQETYSATLSKLNYLLNLGAINTETYGRALKGAQQDLQDTDLAARALSDGFVEMGSSMLTSLAKGETALDSFKNAFSNMMLSIANDILKAKLLEPMSKGIGGIFSSLLGSILGGSSSGSGMHPLAYATPGTSGFAGLAGGGDAEAGKPVWVGERGRELFVPDQSGSVVSNDNLRGGINVQVNVINNTDSKVEVQQNGDSIDVVISKTVARNIMDGGLVHRAVAQSFNVAPRLRN